MLEPFIPKNFCREYVKLGRYIQLPMFMAVVKGIKPLFDDWVLASKYQEYKQVCKKYGSFVKPNCMFIEPPKNVLNKIEKNFFLSTTKKIGKPFDSSTKNAEIHVFVSKSEEKIDEALKFGWYSLIVDDVVISNPLIDHLRFGECLGYPDCCIEFFKDHNREGLNTPFEVLKNTDGNPSFYCNNILMDFTYFLIHHHPCSFRCSKTIKLAKNLLNAIAEEEPEYAQKIEYYLKLPILVFQEKDAIIFDGKLKNDEVFYSDVGWLSFPTIGKSPFEIFKKGNRVKVTKEYIYIFNNESLLHTIKKQDESDGFLIQFS